MTWSQIFECNFFIMGENYDAEKAISVANLAEQARQLILQVKDLSHDIELLNDEIQHFIELMQVHPNVRIVDLTEEDKTVLAYLPSEELEKLQNAADEIEIDEEIEMEVAGTELETWEEFNEIFSDEFTLRGKEMVKNMSDVIAQVESNVQLIARAKENLNEVAEFMHSSAALREAAENFENLISTLTSDLQSSDQILSDLKKVKRIFPAHETLTHEELEAQENFASTDSYEENRPFPNAWS